MFVRHPCCRILVVSNVNADGHDETGLPNGRAKSLCSSQPGPIIYGLQRNSEWIALPMGPGSSFIPPALGFCINPNHAWKFDTVEEALDRSTLVFNCWGYHTEVQAITLTANVTKSKRQKCL
jgi:hypothetical protein